VALRAASFRQGLQANAVAHAAGQRALRAAFVGFFVDMFDMYLPIVVLGPAMSYFQPATLSPALKSTLYYSVFALSLVGRPVGATLFGHFGDKLGRRRVTIISMGGFAVVTLLIGLLPGYESWGITSIVILTLLRFVDGVFLGGEYTGANPLLWSMRPREAGSMGGLHPYWVSAVSGRHVPDQHRPVARAAGRNSQFTVPAVGLARPVFPGSPLRQRDLPLLRKTSSGVEGVGQSRKD